MTFALRITQSQRLATTAQMRLSLDVLSMSTGALAEFVSAEAATNPFVRLRWPMGATSGGDLPDRPAEAGLYAHVLEQVPLCLPAGRAREIAVAFLDALEPSGWLGQPVTAIARAAGCTADEAEAVLAGLQRMEPAGLFARDLRDCLWLQARDRGQDSPAMAAVLDHLPLVALRDPAALARACGIAEAEARLCLARIRAMDPKPGAAFASDATLARSPDLVVRREAGAWRVALNRSDLPEVAVGACPTGLPLGRAAAEALKAATWLARAIAQRHRTTLAVAGELARRQSAFLDHGPAALVPLTQRDLAGALRMHESTVSRVVTGLTIATPHGVMPVKALFPHAAGAEGSGPSTAALRHRIAALVRAEDPVAPLSDAALAARLAAEGLAVARRTVTKHREALGLPPAPDRRAARSEAPRRRPDPRR